MQLIYNIHLLFLFQFQEICIFHGETSFQNQDQVSSVQLEAIPFVKS